MVLKSQREIGIMRDAGQAVGEVLQELGEELAAGMSTWDLDRLAEERLRKSGGIPTFLGYQGYPASICASINNQVVHGIPSKSQVVTDGDIVSLDIGITLNGYVGDTARTYAVGTVSEADQALIDVTREALDQAIAAARVGNRLSDIGHAVQSYVESKGFSVVRDFVGHGIGRQMHEEPQVPNYGAPGRGPRLKAGMVLALEPMVNAGTYEVEVLGDDWTVVTKDGHRSAHFEDTVAITEDGPVVLTRVA